MSVNIGENGRRSVQVEVEVPGSPEVVWQAIATGPGISSWFVPTTVEERVGGSTTSNFGPGMESVSTMTQWDPPHSFTKEGDGMSEGAPTVATQWFVESKSGDTCVVRVVHSWFADTDQWDGEWEAVENGWRGFFSILKLVLENFPGQPSAAFDATGMSSSGEAEAWSALTTPFGLKDAVGGQDARSEEGAPALSGKVVTLGDGDAQELMLLISEPGPGICHFFAMPMGEQAYVSIRFFFFGDSAAATAVRAEPEWQSWFAARFPMGG